MVWIWRWPKSSEFDADFYGFSPAPGSDPRELTEFAQSPLPLGTKAIFKSKFSVKRFADLHCPPTLTIPTVDGLWREIILNFVPEDRVQFVPASISAKGGVLDIFSVLLPFDRVVAIDRQKSHISNMVENVHGTFIYSVKKLALLPNCLNGHHLARDAQMRHLLLISNELKEALSATGQDDPFYTVDEYNECRAVGR